MKGCISVVGIGPGKPDMMTFEAKKTLDEADVIIGYTTYIALLEGYDNKRMISTPMRREKERCGICIEEAMAGNRVALISGGDPGVYGMASLLLEMAADYPDISVKIISGVTAANSAAAILGAPLSNDYCTISLSDILTPRVVMEKRIRAACEGDFVIVFYNPAGKNRKEPFRKALEIIGGYRGENTSCGYVRNAGRDGTKTWTGSLKELFLTDPDMFTTVFIGNSVTEIRDERLITPRGYVL